MSRFRFNSRFKSADWSSRSFHSEPIKLCGLKSDRAVSLIRGVQSRTLKFGIGISLGLWALNGFSAAHAKEQNVPQEGAQPGVYKEGLPLFTKEDVAKHRTRENRIWVSYGSGVYDVTEFVEGHPGGDKILLAAGSALEPFWNMYAQHSTPEVAEILEGLRIGNLERGAESAAQAADPYAYEPNRHPALVVRSAKPYNAETPPPILTQTFITPNDLFYVRNHLPVPFVDPEKYVLEVSVEGKLPVHLTLHDLETKFPQHSIVATIQCAGNRRNEMSRVKPVRGGSWDAGAISNAAWTGVRLRDVLAYAGFDPDSPGQVQHVQFEGLDRDFEKNYGASIPVRKATSVDGDVILALRMNGEIIPIDHGFPVRAVVPGIVGARNVKWLSRIHASSQESSNHFQQKDYKGFSPNIDWNNVDWKTAPAIQEMPVISAITQPQEGDHIPAGAKEVQVKGYAWSGGGRGIVRVDVSADGGRTWQTASLHNPLPRDYNKEWAWTLWSTSVPVPPLDSSHPSSIALVCRAVDTSYNIQPESVEKIWNLRGVLNNAWHQVNLTYDTSPQIPK